ncbi:hypothetical protein BVI434_1200002 [Burkholderia vietnamiensis]|nr:hypothetical protein BVI434_1200002 [Burkholderia vietnamiensis]
MKKDARASPATGHGGSIDDSVFRARAQEARAAGRRDAGPVGRPGQPAAHRERARRRPRRGPVQAIFPAILRRVRMRPPQ